MTEEIIAAMSDELKAAYRLFTLLDGAIAEATDPFESDKLAQLYMATYKRWEGLRDEITLFIPVP